MWRYDFFGENDSKEELSKALLMFHRVLSKMYDVNVFTLIATLYNQDTPYYMGIFYPSRSVDDLNEVIDDIFTNGRCAQHREGFSVFYPSFPRKFYWFLGKVKTYREDKLVGELVQSKISKLPFYEIYLLPYEFIALTLIQLINNEIEKNGFKLPGQDLIYFKALM